MPPPVRFALQITKSSVTRALCLIFLVVGLFGCDHATKIAAKATLEGGNGVQLAPSVLHGAVELRYVENDDMAFSVLRNLGVPRSPAVLIGLSVVAIVSIAAMFLLARRRSSSAGVVESDSKSSDEENARSRRATQAGLALVLGGALGNIVDRIARGYVVDFIHVKGWPVFNVADIAVVAGMILMALPRFKRRKKQTMSS